MRARDTARVQNQQVTKLQIAVILITLFVEGLFNNDSTLPIDTTVFPAETTVFTHFHGPGHVHTD